MKRRQDIPQAGERIEVDATPLNLLCADPEDPAVSERPQSTIAVDPRTRAIVGIAISLEAPSALTIVSGLQSLLQLRVTS